MSRVLKARHNIQAIKYFTAKVDGRNDPDAPTRQDTYIRALQAYIPEFSVYYGHFLTNPKSLPRVAPPHKIVSVLNTEEKGSDVNLAVHLLNDAWLNVFDAAFVVSNDSDLVEAIRLVKQQRRKMIGVVTPWRFRTAAVLAIEASLILRLRKGVLSASQLPDRIPGTTIHKPRTW